ncbi:MAG TPA: murein biosynthesis integral membrane protein MurJ [Tepidisphaeraceae bacterium]|jgi:putative peptidoglycan lipid II flippase|nr:murein biosynthesis integral membrane protein MurJ [Tepidisphaeraceae bacterium]
MAPTAPPTQPPPARSFLAYAKIVGGLTLVSRFVGLAREMVSGHYLGTGLVATAFSVAFTIPNLFRKLFGEGALSAAFIPLYAQANKHDTKENANAFAAASVNLLAVILLAITIVGELVIFGILRFNDDLLPDRVMTLHFVAIMLPYVLLICGGAFLAGILQVHRRFGAPAAAPIILNLCHIGVLFIGAKVLHLKAADDTLETIRLQAILAYWLSGFVLVAGVLQVAVLLPGLKAAGFTFDLRAKIRTPLVRKMLLLSVPVAMGAGVLQLSVLLDRGISYFLMQTLDEAHQLVTHVTILGQSIRLPLELGAPRRLELAQFLYQFPLGVFAIALATAIFPGLSADALDKDRDAFRGTLRQGVEATIWEGLPASLGLILVAEPTARLLFQHGQISEHDALLIAQSTRWYAGAIWAFSLLQIVNRAYYAIHDTVTPLVMSVVNILLNLVIEIPLLWTPLGESAMAVGTLVSFAIQAAIMLWLLDRRLGGLGLRSLAVPVMKMLLATLLMGLACYAIKLSPIYPTDETRLTWATQLLLLMSVGAAVYFGACFVLGVDVMKQFLPKRWRR